MAYEDVIELVGIAGLIVAVALMVLAAFMVSAALGVFAGGLLLAVLSSAIIIAANRGSA